MRSSLVPKTVFALTLGAACCISGERDAQAFDTFWHSASTGAVGRQFGFSDDANNILQFGNFGGPDFFGPFYDTVEPMVMRGHHADDWPAALPARKVAIFMHFDNLNGKITSNGQFDYLFVRLLWNTHLELLRLFGDGNMVEGQKKIAILETLGAALHMVQDFYSHSDWIHADFPAMGLPYVKTPWGPERAPTWFEVRAKLGDPDCWPFKVQSGIYPPVSGSLQTHTHMNHDNSQLIYPDEGYKGSPNVPQMKYHMAGPMGAQLVGAREHQLFAVNTAAAASIEFVTLLEQRFPSAQAAIDYAHGWNVRAYNPAMLNHLSEGLQAALFFSCFKHKWDGPKAPPSRTIPCGAAKMGLMGVDTLAGFLTEFWSNITSLNLLEHLTQGFSSVGDDYVFDPTYVKSVMPPSACPSPSQGTPPLVSVPGNGPNGFGPTGSGPGGSGPTGRGPTGPGPTGSGPTGPGPTGPGPGPTGPGATAPTSGGGGGACVVLGALCDVSNDCCDGNVCTNKACTKK